MIRIGIVGSIGSGKTYIANKFGFPVFNADSEVNKLYKNDKICFKKLNKIFPKQIDTFPISKSTHDREIGKKIPLTYVPLRNTIFLSIAAGLLESIILKKIEIGKSDITDITASIYLGPNIVDFSGYPDCKPEFFSQISETIRMGSKLGTQYGIEIQIQTPLLHMSKSEIVRLGMELGSPISSTWSCYIGKELPCHLCESCQLRARGFSEAGIVDPSL